MPPFRSFLARGASLSAPVQGALYMTVAAFLFALMNGAIRLLGDGWGADGGEGMHPFQIAFLRNLFALAFMLPWLLRHRRGGLATGRLGTRSEEHTSELQSLMRISYAVFCLKQKNTNQIPQ